MTGYASAGIGYPDTALADANALEDARAGGQAGTLMYAQFHTSLTNVLCANYAAATAQSDEVVRLADEKNAAIWKASATMQKGCVAYAEVGQFDDRARRARRRSVSATL